MALPTPRTRWRARATKRVTVTVTPVSWWKKWLALLRGFGRHAQNLSREEGAGLHAATWRCEGSVWSSRGDPRGGPDAEWSEWARKGRASGDPRGDPELRNFRSNWRPRPELRIRAEPRQGIARAIGAQRVAWGGCRGPATDLRMCAHASSHGTTPDCQHASGRSCRSPRGSAVTRPVCPRTTDAPRDERRAAGDRHQDPASKHRRP